MIFRYSIILLLIVFNCTIEPLTSQGQEKRIINLNDNWQFSSEIFDQDFQVTIPGSVHTDLFSNNLIDDPYKSDNEKHLQWIDTLSWIYKKEFKKPKGINPDDQIELFFHGLDTYADIYLNDSLLLSANNMFVSWKVKIDESDLKNKNTLLVIFYPVHAIENKLATELPYKLPENNRLFTRKAAYHYGWDWGPKYITTGIWQDVEMHIWKKARINHVSYSIQKLDSTEAIINFKIDIEANQLYKANIQIECPESNINSNFEYVPLVKGSSSFETEIKINDPKLWWTHNLGDPYLHNFKVSLTDGNLLDSEEINVGIRTIELVQERDELGKSFYYKLNDVPVYMKGANYIPQSSFPGTVSDDEYKTIIKQVKDANMNMLRVWGGGIYEKDIFYNLCDKHGILVWQDFMFANSMFPGDSAFLNNVKEEANFQLTRLKSHPSIAVWCGNNEIDEAWHNWGWSTNYSKTDSAEIWNNYIKIFHEILPDAVEKINPEISYTSSSPLFGRGNPRSSYEGDNHYWYVWHDAYDFNWYNKVTGRFMSEFGFQSFPSMETIEYFDDSKKKEIDSEIMLTHQKHHRGNYLINHYMKDYYPIPDDFKDFIYVSQLVQAEGIRTGILAQRRVRPFCMGSLYWQLNDCWPAISWSSIDFSGNWKALHYFAKRDFKNIIIDPIIHDNSLEIFIVSDSLEDISGNLHLTLYDFYGQIKNKKSIPVEIKKNSSSPILTSSMQELLGQNKTSNHLIFAELKSDEKIIDKRVVLFEKPIDLSLNKINFNSKINEISNGYEIILKSNVFIKSLFFEKVFDGEWSDNYFDLIPGKEKRLIFKTSKKIKDPTQLLKYNSVNQITNN